MSQFQLQGQKNFHSKNKAETDTAMLLSRAAQLRLSTAWTCPRCSQPGLAHEQTSKTFPNLRASPNPHRTQLWLKGNKYQGFKYCLKSKDNVFVQVSCSKTTQLPSRSGDNTSLHGTEQIQSERTHHLLGNYSSDTTAQIFMYCKLLLNSSASSS